MANKEDQNLYYIMYYIMYFIILYLCLAAKPIALWEQIKVEVETKTVWLQKQRKKIEKRKQLTSKHRHTYLSNQSR